MGSPWGPVAGLLTDERETACMYVRSGPDVLLLDAGTEKAAADHRARAARGRRASSRRPVALSSRPRDGARRTCRSRPRMGDLDAGASPCRPVGRPGLRASRRPPFFTGTDVVGMPRELEGDCELGPLRDRGPRSASASGQDDRRQGRRQARLLHRHRLRRRERRRCAARPSSSHESFWPGDTTDDPGHTAAGEAARLAAESGVERLVLVHINPEGCDDDEPATSARAHFAASDVVRDGLVVM